MHDKELLEIIEQSENPNETAIYLLNYLLEILKTLQQL